MTEHLFKLKDDGKVIGYLKISNVCMLLGSIDGLEWRYITNQNPAGDLQLSNNQWIHFYDTAHPFVTKDRLGKDAFAGDEVLVYQGKKNIGEGYIFFNDRFLWWTVNNSSQDNDREYPQDWSQLTLCDVDIEIIEDKE